MSTNVTLTKAQITDFYNGINYQLKARPYKPRELNIPNFLANQEPEVTEKICKRAENKIIHLKMGYEECRILAPILLHESLFHFYKAIYNYLAARSLYFAGMSHWINITLYYCNFYIARATTTLLGRQSYHISNKRLRNDFVEAIAKALAPNSKMPNSYRIYLHLDFRNKLGELKFDSKPVRSHHDIWEMYRSLDVQSIGLFSVLFGDQSEIDLLDERNEENYSFNGYSHLDFNISPSAFKAYFEDNYIKELADTIYDLDSGGVLLALSSLWRFYRSLNVDNLPLENEKISYMIEYSLPESQAKDTLLLLCKENFPTEQLYSDDGDRFYDEQGRYL